MRITINAKTGAGSLRVQPSPKPKPAQPAEPVEGGVLGELKKLIDSLSGVMDKFFKGFEEAGLKILKQKKVDGGIKYRVSFNDVEADVTVLYDEPGEDKSDATCTLICQSDNGRTDKFEKTRLDDIDKVMRRWMRNAGMVKANRFLEVTLQRIQGSTEDEIRLVAVNANYNVNTMMANLNAVLANDELLDLITDEPITIEIQDAAEPEFFDVDEVPALTCMNNVDQILAAGSTMMCNLQMIAWNLKGNNCSQLRQEIQNWYHSATWDMQQLGELSVELCGSAPNIGHILHTESLVPSNVEYTEDGVYSIVYDQMSNYIMALETYYVNFEHDVQSILDNMIRFWTKERDYKVARTLKSC